MAKSSLILIIALCITAYLNSVDGKPSEEESNESLEEKKSKVLNIKPTRPFPTHPIKPIVLPPPVTDEYCDSIKPCGQTCPEHSSWGAGNYCTDSCGREAMICDQARQCGCYCTGNYRKDKNGLCIHKNCCQIPVNNLYRRRLIG